jgi:hypothetical protein
MVALPVSAGPPFSTDDPEPVDLGHLELYLAATRLGEYHHASGTAPQVEVNWGLLSEAQVHLVAPLAYDTPPGGDTRRGLGNIELGVKLRLLDETASRPQIGIFPLVELPTGDASRGLGAGHTQLYLPVWLQKSWGPWTTYGGAGWWRNPGDGQRDWVFTGWLLQRDLSAALTVGAEFFHTTPSTTDGEATTGYTVGAIVNLSEHHHLLASAGRTFAGPSQSRVYVGYQLTTGPVGTLGEWLGWAPSPAR